jgi:protein-arginine kinase activator protein McsA
VIRKYLTIYLVSVAIKEFKKARTESYVRCMGCLTFDEINNAESVSECFKRFKEVIQDYNIAGTMPGPDGPKGGELLFDPKKVDIKNI